MTQVWSFSIGRVELTLEIEQEPDYQYDGDDEDGETQRKIDCGDYVAFRSTVRCYIDSMEMGRDDLGGSVYEFGKESEFWTAHRTSLPEYRNTLAQREAKRCVGHYFPDMVRTAIDEARETRKELAKLRANG
jgi:hypothetical protein